MFETSQRSFHDIVEIMAHLSAQDEELLKQTRLLLQLSRQPAPEADVEAATGTATAGAATPATRARNAKPQR